PGRDAPRRVSTTRRRLWCPSSRGVDEAAREVAVGVDAAVAEERPLGAEHVDAREVQLDREDGLFVGRGAGDDAAVGAGDEALAPEVDAVLRVVFGRARRR